jgi:type II secretory pathway pseudopilin PulG
VNTQSASGEKVRHRRQRLKLSAKMDGFTFIGLMAIIAIMGVMLLAVGEVWHIAQKREKEVELLFVGNQFRKAIASYYANTPAASKQQPYPTSLEDLLKDPRYPSTERYLRKIYIDPISNNAEWGIVKNPNGGIYGVYSQSNEEPIKQSNFLLANMEFEGKTKYSEWIFMYVKTLNASAPAVTSSNAPVVTH